MSKGKSPFYGPRHGKKNLTSRTWKGATRGSTCWHLIRRPQEFKKSIKCGREENATNENKGKRLVEKGMEESSSSVWNIGKVRSDQERLTMGGEGDIDFQGAIEKKKTKGKE